MSEKEVTIEKDGGKTIIHKTINKGLSFGSALAMVISFVTWKSVGWAILHGIFGWVYVIYYVIRYGFHAA